MNDLARDLVSIFSVAFGAASIVFAFYQHSKATKIKKLQVNKLRSTLKNTLLIMSQSYRLVRDGDILKINDPTAVTRISAIHSTSTDLVRFLFQELSDIDKPFDENKLLSYVKSQLITSKWVWEQAITYVDEPIKMPDLPEDTPDYLRPNPNYNNSIQPNAAAPAD